LGINRERDYEFWQDAHIHYDEENNCYDCYDEVGEYLMTCETRTEARARLDIYEVGLIERNNPSNNG